jgi:hypothetical protein
MSTKVDLTGGLTYLLWCMAWEALPAAKMWHTALKIAH